MGTDPSAETMAALERYLRAVNDRCGFTQIRPDIITPDDQPGGGPLTAILPVDGTPPDLPEGADLCLVWTETHGWSAHIVHDADITTTPVAYLGGPVLPPPEHVAAFAEDLIRGRHPLEPDPTAPTPRPSNAHDDLIWRLRGFRVG